ncbi:unnamed protein product [Rhizoctonia solani]|uniref:Uncharacterized protein n=1 Tax=Rhizoctonia solani TaxID=456999 RepID=A0A8H2WD21_9AGAM|nr:unnamed protein product [Rhizoctonia solani]
MIRYIAVLAVFVTQAIALAWTNATCVSEAWSFNSQGQSSCLVSAYLGAQCTADNSTPDPESLSRLIANDGVAMLAFRVHALTGDGPYGFDKDGANKCLCNSVMWNLLSACALCQGKLSGTWAQWVMYCPDNLITIGKYPVPLPTGVSVPSWAYYDFTTTGFFDARIASQQSGSESSAIIASATSTPDSTAASTGTGSSTSTPNPIATTSHSTSNTGAIIGGVVGGILGIGLICLIALVLLRKRKHEEAATQPNSTNPAVGHLDPHQMGIQASENKPYNPSSPSFPASPMTKHYAESLPYSYQSQGVASHPPHPNLPQV